MVQPNRSKTHRRRAVYSALESFIENDELLRAMWLWENKYANGDSIRLRPFVDELVEKGLTEDNPHKIYKALVFFSMQSESHLLADPFADMLTFQNSSKNFAQDNDASSPSFQTPDEIVIFCSLFDNFISFGEKFFNSLRRSLIQDFRLQQNIRSLSSVQTEHFVTWLSNKEPHLTLAYEDKQLAQLLHQAYVVSCEWMGPVTVDRCLALALEQTEKLPEAINVSPKRFL